GRPRRPAPRRRRLKSRSGFDSFLVSRFSFFVLCSWFFVLGSSFFVDGPEGTNDACDRKRRGFAFRRSFSPSHWDLHPANQEPRNEEPRTKNEERDLTENNNFGIF